MALKKVTAALPAAAKTKKDEMPESHAAGDAVRRFDLAVAQVKAATAVKEELEAQLKAAGFAAIYRLNCGNPFKPATSVRLIDETGSTARFSHTSKYAQADGEQADAIFTQMGADINAFAQETVKATFDSKVFLNADGEFDQTRYDKFKAAIDVVAASLNVISPLSAKTVVLPKPAFEAERWTAFTIEQQSLLQVALPAVVSLTAGDIVMGPELSADGPQLEAVPQPSR